MAETVERRSAREVKNCMVEAVGFGLVWIEKFGCVNEVDGIETELSKETVIEAKVIVRDSEQRIE